MFHDLPRGDLRRHHRLGLVVRARRRGKQQVEIGDRLIDGVEQFGLIQDMIGAGGGALRADAGPAVPRAHQPQPRQREIAHRARRHADIFAKLRLDQNDHGPGEVEAGLALVGTRTRHLASLSRIKPGPLDRIFRKRSKFPSPFDSPSARISQVK